MTTRVVFTVLVALAFGLGYWSAPMATLFLNDEGKILFAPDTSSPMYDEECCCDVPCCTADEPETITASPSGTNFGCVVAGDTLVPSVLTRMNTNRAAPWPLPADTYYWYGNCLSSPSSDNNRLVVWCDNGVPSAFIWSTVGTGVLGNYVLVSCSGNPLEWVFTDDGGFGCLECILNFTVTE